MCADVRYETRLNALQAPRKARLRVRKPRSAASSRAWYRAAWVAGEGGLAVSSAFSATRRTVQRQRGRLPRRPVTSPARRCNLTVDDVEHPDVPSPSPSRGVFDIVSTVLLARESDARVARSRSRTNGTAACGGKHFGERGQLNFPTHRKCPNGHAKLLTPATHERSIGSN